MEFECFVSACLQDLCNLFTFVYTVALARSGQAATTQLSTYWGECPVLQQGAIDILKNGKTKKKRVYKGVCNFTFIIILLFRTNE